MRWLTNFDNFSFKWTPTTAIGIHPTKPWLSHLVNFKNAIWMWGHFRRKCVYRDNKCTVWCQCGNCTQLFTWNWRYGRFARSLSQGCSEKIRKKDVVMTAGKWSSWSIQIPHFLILCRPVMKAGSMAMTQRPRDRVPSGSMLALPDPRRQDRANPPTNLWWYFFFWQHWHDLNELGSHWTDSQQGILCWGFKGVQEEIPLEKASTLQIGSVAFPPG